MTATTLSTEQRKNLFRALIDTQDAGLSVAQSRTDTAERFGVTVEDVKAIEDEGIAKQWPPLSPGECS